MINVAVDGPAGAGKSTIARRIACDMGYVYIDTGAMYRSLAYKALKNNINIKNDYDSVCEMLSDTRIDIKHKDGVQRMYVDGTDVTDCIRTPEISLGASDIAAIPEVRHWLLGFQRGLAAANNCIMDGRDIGTKVLPDANVKIFLTASAEARAKRRFSELKLKGADVTYSEVLNDIIKRDENDSTRECSPLAKAEDAVLVDTSELDFEQAVCAVKKVLSDKVGDK